MQRTKYVSHLSYDFLSELGAPPVAVRSGNLHLSNYFFLGEFLWNCVMFSCSSFFRSEDNGGCCCVWVYGGVSTEATAPCWTSDQLFVAAAAQSNCFSMCWSWHSIFTYQKVFTTTFLNLFLPHAKLISLLWVIFKESGNQKISMFCKTVFFSLPKGRYSQYLFTGCFSPTILTVMSYIWRIRKVFPF